MRARRRGRLPVQPQGRPNPRRPARVGLVAHRRARWIELALAVTRLANGSVASLRAAHRRPNSGMDARGHPRQLDRLGSSTLGARLEDGARGPGLDRRTRRPANRAVGVRLARSHAGPHRPTRSTNLLARSGPDGYVPPGPSRRAEPRAPRRAAHRPQLLLRRLRAVPTRRRLAAGPARGRAPRPAPRARTRRVPALDRALGLGHRHDAHRRRRRRPGAGAARRAAGVGRGQRPRGRHRDLPAPRCAGRASTWCCASRASSATPFPT